jgi:cytoskeletal protein RodZ
VPNTQRATCVSTDTVPTASRIELPRPAIIAALGVLILAVTFLVTKPGDNTGSASSSPPASTSTTATTASSSTSATSTSATTATKAPAKPKQPAVTPGAGLPADVAGALNAHKIVVLFFYEPAASDDQATKAAIRAVRTAGGPGARQVRLFQDVVARISDYRRVTGSLGISQSPAMVVIDRDRHAELLQGYLDSGTIKQTVRDSF